MVRCLGLDLAVVAEDIRKEVGIFWRHLLFCQEIVNLGVVRRHVAEGLPACRTLV